MKISKFSIDMDDTSDIKRHITILQKRRKNLLREKAAKKAATLKSAILTSDASGVERER